MSTNRALLPLKVKIKRFLKPRSTRYCFEPLLKIIKMQKVYQSDIALQAFWKTQKFQKINCYFNLSYRLILMLLFKDFKKITKAFLLWTTFPKIKKKVSKKVDMLEPRVNTTFLEGVQFFFPYYPTWNFRNRDFSKSNFLRSAYDGAQ